MNVVVTDASRGMGKAIATKFAKEGYNLFLSSKNKQLLAECVNELSQLNDKIKVSSYATDLSIKGEAKEFGQWILNQNQDIDILINNAGNFLPGSIYNEADGTLEKMMERKEGHIINMCSIASLNAYRNGGSYSISKFALMGFSKNLREELKPYN